MLLRQSPAARAGAAQEAHLGKQSDNTDFVSRYPATAAFACETSAVSPEGRCEP